jgi:hypothetical protein
VSGQLHALAALHTMSRIIMLAARISGFIKNSSFQDVNSNWCPFSSDSFTLLSNMFTLLPINGHDTKVRTTEFNFHSRRKQKLK